MDLADYWRGGLSLRRLSVLVHNLPADAALARKAQDVAPGWDTHAFLLADLFYALTGEHHPARPQPKDPGKATRAATLRRALEAQKARVAAPTK